MTAWTSDSGARAMAATWKIQAPMATPMPIANHREVQRFFALRSGCFHSTVRRSTCATVLEQEAQVREKRAQKREQYADLNGHE